MLAEIDEIRKTLFSWLIVFFLLATFLFFFNLKKIEIANVSLMFPVFSTNSLSLTIFQKIYSDLVPQNIKLLVTNPLNVLLIQVQVSLFFAFLISLPVLLYKLLLYLFPALYSHEKKMIKRSIIPSFLLFILGCIFAYSLLVPLTLRIMNSYNSPLNAATYFEINEFITFSLVAIFTSGIAFMLPIFMKVLSNLEIVSPSFWIRNFKYSLIAIAIFTAIITPDGTGVTMVMLSIPLISLYLLGWFLSKERTERSSLA